MKRFLFILIVFGIVFGVDMIVGIFSKDLILNAPDVGINQTNSVQALFYRKSDILILGPSTANHHYNTKILEDSLRLSAYNSGYDGKNILYSAMVFYSYLQRCSPKLVCMDMLAPMMNDTWNASVSEMNAFYGLSSEVDRVIDDVSSMIKKMELCSNLYRYNNSWQWLLHATMSASHSDMDGYRPLAVNTSANLSQTYDRFTSFRVDSTNLRYLDGIVGTCRKRGIKLLFSVSPTLKVVSNDEFLTWLHRYCNGKGVMLIDFSHDRQFIAYPDLFYDATHLNSKGADLFTECIVSRLKPIIRERRSVY